MGSRADPGPEGFVVEIAEKAGTHHTNFGFIASVILVDLDLMLWIGLR